MTIGSRSNYTLHNPHQNANPNVPPRPVLERENIRNYAGIHVYNGANFDPLLREVPNTARTHRTTATTRRIQQGGYKKKSQKKRKSSKRRRHLNKSIHKRKRNL